MQFDEQYYMNGPATGISNYVNYRWLPDLTIPLANKFIELLNIKKGETVLDYGCARGYLVKALRLLGVDAIGCDISDWAIANCDKAVQNYVFSSMPRGPHDHIISKDVLEHIPMDAIQHVVKKLNEAYRESMLFIVPLAKETGGEYFRKEDEQDATHQIRWTFMDWFTFFQNNTTGMVLGSMHIEVLKPASKEVPGSTGFYLIKK